MAEVRTSRVIFKAEHKWVLWPTIATAEVPRKVTGQKRPWLAILKKKEKEGSGRKS